MSRENPFVRWHTDRARSIAAQHPDVVALATPDWRTSILIAALVAVHVNIALWLRHAPWQLAVVIGWIFGAFVAHALGVAIHDCAHDAVFRRRAWNRALSIFANIPLVFPAAIDFREKHLQHHRTLGTIEDTQAPTPIQDTLARGPVSKIAWLTVGPMVFHAKHAARRSFGEIVWLAANALACAGGVAVVYWLGGPSAVVYLGVSGLAAFGPHPVGIRRYAEHFPVREGQPTASYYGPLNAVALNVGHHVEHHDFPSVPWTRLPALRKLAREHYDELAAVDSWTWLLLRFFFKREVRVADYVRRDWLTRTEA